MNVKALLSILFVAYLWPPAAHAGSVPFGLDPAFATGGRYNAPFPGADFRVLAHLQRPDGTSVAVAYYDNNLSCPAGRHCLALYPFNAAGALVGALTVPQTVAASFSKLSGGVVLDPVLVKAAAIDSQGRIVIVGTEQFGTAFDYKVVRLLPNGQPDVAFDGDGAVTIDFNGNEDRAFGVGIEPISDKIVVVGQVRLSPNDTDFGIVRLQANGALDASFNGNGKRTVPFDLSSTNTDRAIAVTATSNLIYIAGTATDNGVSRIALTRLLNSGSYNTGFCSPSCSFQGTYTAINSGRRVIFYGSQGTTSDFVEAASVNLSASPAQWVYAGTRNSGAPNFISQAFVQKVAPNGDYANEVLTDGGFAATSQYRIGGVHWVDPNAANSSIVLTGTSGLDGIAFFAQGMNSLLVATANWGTAGPSNSVALYAATGGLGDANGNNLPAQSSVDSAGRVLLGGSYLSGASNLPPYSISIARFRGGAIVPPADPIFSNGFEN